jgi:hypothetical protein
MTEDREVNYFIVYILAIKKITSSVQRDMKNDKRAKAKDAAATKTIDIKTYERLMRYSG